MQVELSARTEERLQELVDQGRYSSLEAALDAVVAENAEQEAQDDEALTARLDKARSSALAGRHVLLTDQVAERVKREGRARLHGTDSPQRH